MSDRWKSAFATATSSFRWLDKLSFKSTTHQTNWTQRSGTLVSGSKLASLLVSSKKKVPLRRLLFSDWMGPRREMDALIWRKEEAQPERKVP